MVSHGCLIGWGKGCLVIEFAVEVRNGFGKILKCGFNVNDIGMLAF